MRPKHAPAFKDYTKRPREQSKICKMHEALTLADLKLRISRLRWHGGHTPKLLPQIIAARLLRLDSYHISASLTGTPDCAEQVAASAIASASIPSESVTGRAVPCVSASTKPAHSAA